MSNTPACNRSVNPQTLPIALWISASEVRKNSWIHTLDQDRAARYAIFVRNVTAAAIVGVAAPGDAIYANDDSDTDIDDTM